MKQLMTAAILATLVGAPAFAQSVTDQTGNLGRDAIVRECNLQASKAYPTRDSNWSFSAYRACMAEHGQSE